MNNGQSHILDNAVFNAFSTGNKHLAQGNASVKFLSKEITFFVGLNEFSAINFQQLAGFIEPERVVGILAPNDFQVPTPWKSIAAIEVDQMVYTGVRPTIEPNPEIISLGMRDVPAMIELTKMTNPGPFESETILLGFYEGIYRNHRLIAMAGQRMHPVPYAELSAVCTHPEFRGEGLSTQLMKRQISRILDSEGIPFLHVKSENEQAIRLYQKMGFKTRKSLTVYVIKQSIDDQRTGQ